MGLYARVIWFCESSQAADSAEELAINYLLLFFRYAGSISSTVPDPGFAIDVFHLHESIRQVLLAHTCTCRMQVGEMSDWGSALPLSRLNGELAGFATRLTAPRSVKSNNANKSDIIYFKSKCGARGLLLERQNFLYLEYFCAVKRLRFLCFGKNKNSGFYSSFANWGDVLVAHSIRR